LSQRLATFWLVTPTTRYATTYKRPSTILQGRIIRLGADVRW